MPASYFCPFSMLLITSGPFFLNPVAGACFAPRDAGKINFRIVHVVAQVAPHAPCGSILTSDVTLDARGHSSSWTKSPKAWPS